MMEGGEAENEHNVYAFKIRRLLGSRKDISTSIHVRCISLQKSQDTETT